jgi:hypothetical protein
MREDGATSGGNRSFDAGSRSGFDYKSYAASAARSAHLASNGTLLARLGNDAIDRRSRDRGQVTPAKFPLRANQSAHFVPIVAQERCAHLARDIRDLLEIAGHAPVAINVSHENFPIVDGGLPRLSGVAEHQAALEFV